jgi:hypothetical protein
MSKHPLMPPSGRSEVGGGRLKDVFIRKRATWRYLAVSIGDNGQDRAGLTPPYTASSSRRPNMGVGGNVVWFVQHSGGGDGADDDQVLVVLVV